MPQLSSQDTTDRLMAILCQLSQAEIRRALKVISLLYYRRVTAEEQLSESETIGYEKAVVFSLQLLDLDGKVKDLINRDNAIPAKKSPFSFYINYNKYKEGEFV